MYADKHKFYFFPRVNIMGVSVSQSNAVREMAEYREIKRRANNKNEREVQPDMSHNVFHSSQKQNRAPSHQQNPSPHQQLREPPNLKRKGLKKDVQCSQKNQAIVVKPRIGKGSSYQFKKQGQENEERRETVEKLGEKESEKGGVQLEQQTHMVKQNLPVSGEEIEEIVVKEVLVKPSKKQALQRMSSLSSPDVVKHNRGNKELDVSVCAPSACDIIVQSYNIASMALALSSKFQQDRGSLDEITYLNSLQKTNNKPKESYESRQHDTVDPRRLTNFDSAHSSINIQPFSHQ